MIITKTKQDLVKEVARQAGISQRQAEDAVNTVTDAITGTVKGLGRFALAGVGVFYEVNRAARTGRNPQDGSAIDIPAKKAVKFKTAADWQRAMNG